MRMPAVLFVDEPCLRRLCRGAVDKAAYGMAVVEAAGFAQFEREARGRLASAPEELVAVVDAHSVLKAFGGAFAAAFQRWLRAAGAGICRRVVLVHSRFGSGDQDALHALVGDLQPFVRQSLVHHAGADQEFMDLLAAVVGQMLPALPGGAVNCAHCRRLSLAPPLVAGNVGAGDVEFRVTEEEGILLELLMPARGGVRWQDLSSELYDRMGKRDYPSREAVQRAVSRLCEKLTPDTGHAIAGGKRYEWRCAEAGLETGLSRLNRRRLAGPDLAAVFIVDEELGGHRFVAAAGADRSGRRRPVGVWPGTTDDPTVRRKVLDDLKRRCLGPKGKRLFVVGGNEALAAELGKRLKSGAVVQDGNLDLSLPKGLAESLKTTDPLCKVLERARREWHTRTWKGPAEAAAWVATALLEDEKEGGKISEHGAMPGFLEALLERDFTGPACAGERGLRRLTERSLTGMALESVWIEGAELAGHSFIVALGTKALGAMTALALWEGRTTQAKACQAVIDELAERGLDPEREYLFVLDGARSRRCRLGDLRFGDAQQMKTSRAKMIGKVIKGLHSAYKGSFERFLTDRLDQASDMVSGMRECVADLDAWNGTASGREKEQARAAARILVELLREGEGLDPRLYSAGTQSPFHAAFEALARGTARKERWAHAGQAQLWAAGTLMDAEQGRRPELLEALGSRIRGAGLRP